MQLYISWVSGSIEREGYHAELNSINLDRQKHRVSHPATMWRLTCIDFKLDQGCIEYKRDSTSEHPDGVVGRVEAP